jgi:hypothetical protein
MKVFLDENGQENILYFKRTGKIFCAEQGMIAERCFT